MEFNPVRGLVAALALVMLSCAPAAESVRVDASVPVDASIGDASEDRDSGAPDELSVVLENARARAGVPALAALEIEDGEVVQEAAVGRRRADAEAEVTLDDRWHLGSCTKAMTAALVALIAGDGALGFDTTLAEAFPGEEIHEQLRSVTLHQLLIHRAGLPEDRAPTPDIIELLSIAGPVREARAEVARRLLALAPAVAPGTETRYSNFGYVLVGAALERATGERWEDLLTARLFAPLGMTSCGFGAPDASHAASPTGHVASSEGGSLRPVPGFDNAPLLGPAGTVHCTLRDWARFVDWSMQPPADGPVALSPEAQARLRTPSEDGFASGWLVTTQPWATGPVFVHQGSNTAFLAVVWSVPEERRALFAVTNAATAGAGQALDAAILGMLDAQAR